MGKRAKNQVNVNTNTIKRIARMTNMFDYQVKEVLIKFIQCVVADLAQGKTVAMLSLGKFFIKKIPPKGGFDPIRKIKKQFGTRYMPKFRYGATAEKFIREELENSGARRRHRERS